MLVDITPRPSNQIDPIAKMIAQMGGRMRHENLPRRLDKGVWLFGSWNPEMEIVDEIEREGYGPKYTGDKEVDDRLWREYIREDSAKREALVQRYLDQYKIEIVSEYDDDLPPVADGVTRITGYPDNSGVCDSYQQVLEQRPHLADDPEPYFIALVELRREDQPSDGGWRWHKWGRYIGTQDPQHEYLFDEKHIDVVYTFHVYKLTASADEALSKAGYTFMPALGSDTDFVVLFEEVVAGQKRKEALGVGPKTDMIAKCYDHNAQMAEIQVVYNLEAEGYSIRQIGDIWSTGLDGVSLGTFGTKDEAIRRCVNYKRDLKRKQKEEAANG